MMDAKYLIKLVEDFCEENGFGISEIYAKMANTYQETYGVNINKQMTDNGKYDMALYLEEIGIIDRYIHILNGYKKCVSENWVF